MNVFFIGNRFNVLKMLLAFEEQITIIKIYVLKNSPLVMALKNHEITHEIFSLNDKQLILEKIMSSKFDILISNGCPFVLPVSKIILPHQKFINVHPTYLPYLKGNTPINGVFFNKMTFFGATMHFMDDGVDTGQIIYREKVDLTSDIDLPLIYYMSFRMEGIVFKKGFKKYILDNESIPTIKHEKGSVFNREPILQILDFNASNDIIISKIKAFGISSQGCHTEIEGKRILIFSANEIKNKTLLSWFDKNSIGEILLDIDKSLYIKTREGIIKLNRFKWDN